MVHARRLGPAVHLSSGVPIVARLLGNVYPEVKKQVDRVAEAVRAVEVCFGVALRQGMERWQPLLERGTLNPQEVFYLHDTLGFPIELTAELAGEKGVTVDLEAVAALMQVQRDRSRVATGGFAAPQAGTASQFVGYDHLEADATVTDVFPVAGQPDQADVFLDETPFYAERGGQTADNGVLTWNGASARVIDVQPQGEAIRHRVGVIPDRLKAGDRVHVVSFGDWARELCGGTHVERSGEIGLALISNDRSIGAGIRRIELRAGEAAEQQVRDNERVLRELGDALRTSPSEFPSRVAAFQAEIKRLEREATSLRQKLAAGGGAQLEEADVEGVRLMLQRVDEGERDLLLFADEALNRANGNGVAIVVAGRNFAIKVASPLSERLAANDLIQAFRQVAGGKGGGKGQVGQGGGIDPARVAEAFTSLQDYVRQHLKENA